jgi:hypothetical protein
MKIHIVETTKINNRMFLEGQEFPVSNFDPYLITIGDKTYQLNNDMSVIMAGDLKEPDLLTDIERARKWIYRDPLRDNLHRTDVVEAAHEFLGADIRAKDRMDQADYNVRGIRALENAIHHQAAMEAPSERPQVQGINQVKEKEIEDETITSGSTEESS